MAFAVAHGIGVSETIAGQVASARVASGGAVGFPAVAEQDVLHEVNQGGFSRASGAGNKDVIVNINDFAKTIPVDGNDAGKGYSEVAHGTAGVAGLPSSSNSGEGEAASASALEASSSLDTGAASSQRASHAAMSSKGMTRGNVGRISTWVSSSNLPLSEFLRLTRRRERNLASIPSKAVADGGSIFLKYILSFPSISFTDTTTARVTWLMRTS